ncbi:MAG: GDSL-type esterase/lipase family protein [Armatimonadota bacterium]
MDQRPHRIVCLGDSITWAGHWVDLLSALFAVRDPSTPFEVLNLGLPSETVSGLSEDGHAGGAFPRPVLRERLGRVLERTRPDTVIACYGMNDGIYLPFDAARFAAYRSGIEHLERAVHAAGARFHLLTPPVFDQRRGAPGASFDYDTVLDRYGRWLRTRRGARAVDVRTAIQRHLANRRRTDPGAHLAPDGVHMLPFGHWFVAEGAFRALNLPPVPAAPELSADGTASRVAIPLPCPIDPAWDPAWVRLERIAERWATAPVRASDAADGRYVLRSGGRTLGAFDGAALRRGVDLAGIPGLPLRTRAAAVLAATAERQHLLRDAWLAAVGHLRPGMPAGVPISRANEEGRRRASDIERLAEPIVVDLSLHRV